MVGARVGAQVVDSAALFVQVVAVVLLLAALAGRGGGASPEGLAMLAMLTLPLYGGVLEGYWNGQTLGKRLAGIKVVDRQGHEPSFGQAAAQNIPAVVLFSWAVVAVGLVAIATSDRRQRLFDQVAETYVVAANPGPGSGDGSSRSRSSMGSPDSAPRR